MNLADPEQELWQAMRELEAAQGRRNAAMLRASDAGMSVERLPRQPASPSARCTRSSRRNGRGSRDDSVPEISKLARFVALAFVRQSFASETPPCRVHTGGYGCEKPACYPAKTFPCIAMAWQTYHSSPPRLHKAKSCLPKVDKPQLAGVGSP